MQKTVSLNGTWEVVLDPQNTGKRKKYYERTPPGRPIPVPGIVEQVKPFYDGVSWYRTVFAVKKEWRGKVIRLKFGAVNYYAEVWVNGAYAGHHEGGYTPFVLDISAKVVPGDNTLVVRVIDPPRDRAVEGFHSSAPLNRSDIPTWKAGWYHNFGGIWQSVELVVSEKAYIDDIFVIGSALRKKVTAALTIINRGAPFTGTVTVKAASFKKGGGALFTLSRSVRIRRGKNTLTVTRALQKFTAWDCDNPYLYVCQAELKQGTAVLHTDSVRFGIRDFLVGRGTFLLNGKRICLKGFLQQGVYPRTIAFPHNRAMAVKEMKLVKNHGFNYIRAHLKPSPPEILDLADELGILISAEPPLGWIDATAAGARRCRTEVDELVRRDRNHPSVVIWCLFNEISEQVTVNLKRDALMRLAHRLDPTRLVIGNSGTMGAASPYSVTLFPYSGKVRKLIDTHAYFGPTQAGLKKYREDGERGVAAFISEFGALEAPMDFPKFFKGYTDRERKLGLEDYTQYKRYYDSFLDLYKKAGLKTVTGSPARHIQAMNRIHAEGLQLMVSNIRCNPRYSGYAYCQLADASGEIFGATDLWRTPKSLFKGMVRATGTPLANPFIDPRVIRPGDKLKLNVKLVNEHLTGKRYKAVIEVKKRSGATLTSLSRPVTARQWIDDILDKELTIGSGPGKYTVEAKLVAPGRTVSRNAMTFTVLPEPGKQVNTVALFDMARNLGDTFRSLGYQVERGGNNYRKIEHVMVCSMAPRTNPWLTREILGQVKRIVQVGGAVILLEPAIQLFYDDLLPRPVRHQFVMRTMPYVPDHPVFKGLPSRCLMDYEYDPVQPSIFNNPYDILKLGGRVISGAFSSHMWTGPDVYFWGSCLDIIPLGKGHIITCQIKLLNNKSKIAENLLVNLVNYAHSLIRTGAEDKLFGRCIDEVKM